VLSEVKPEQMSLPTPDDEWDVRALINHIVLQFDCALSYGLVEYLRTLEMMAAHGRPHRTVIPHGGQQMSLNIAVGLGLGGNESYPGIFQLFDGFADGTAVVDGYIGPPPGPALSSREKPRSGRRRSSWRGTPGRG
jgi:hypothetical protein